jgi:hypothetical protein
MHMRGHGDVDYRTATALAKPAAADLASALSSSALLPARAAARGQNAAAAAHSVANGGSYCHLTTTDTEAVSGTASMEFFSDTMLDALSCCDIEGFALIDGEGQCLDGDGRGSLSPWPLGLDSLTSMDLISSGHQQSIFELRRKKKRTCSKKGKALCRVCLGLFGPNRSEP